MGKSVVKVKAVKFSQSVQCIRLWEEKNLPLSQSRIAFDLFALVAHSSCTETPLPQKELFNSLKYSERGIRYVLEQFVDGGWCEVVCDTKDKRCRFVVATQRLVDAFASYQEVVLSTYMGCVDGDK